MLSNWEKKIPNLIPPIRAKNQKPIILNLLNQSHSPPKHQHHPQHKTILQNIPTECFHSQISANYFYPSMAKQHWNYPDRKDVTSPFWWCAAIICTIITIGVIIVGIIVFVGYLVIHPRIPNISVVDARLNQFQYDYTGVLITQVTIVLRSQNDNSKAHTSFSDLKLNLIFDGTVIAILQAGQYNVSKHNHVDFNFVSTSLPISLDPQQMQTVDASLNEDRVRFDLKGDAKARWRVGLIGSVRFAIHLECRLEFRRSDGSYIPSPCTSKAK